MSATNKNANNIPSAAIELYKTALKERIITTHFYLPGLHTMSANTARTYTNKGKFGYFRPKLFSTRAQV